MTVTDISKAYRRREGYRRIGRATHSTGVKEDARQLSEPPTGARTVRAPALTPTLENRRYAFEPRMRLPAKASQIARFSFPERALTGYLEDE